MQALIKITLVLFVLAASGAAQPPAMLGRPAFEEVYLAKDDGSGYPGEESTEFAPTDIPIHCVVILGKASPVTVKMDLIAVSVAGVKPESKVISTSYTTNEMQDRVHFNGKPHKLWIAGSYRADIYIDGDLAGRFPFIIKVPAVPKPAMRYQPKQSVKPRSATAKKT
ncbi:MAG: hypothetical protein AB7F88_18505 [Pyrinomonadaceae bacterium]